MDMGTAETWSGDLLFPPVERSRLTTMVLPGESEGNGIPIAEGRLGPRDRAGSPGSVAHSHFAATRERPGWPGHPARPSCERPPGAAPEGVRAVRAGQELIGSGAAGSTPSSWIARATTSGPTWPSRASAVSAATVTWAASTSKKRRRAARVSLRP
jgi:hypothetical protein